MYFKRYIKISQKEMIDYLSNRENKDYSLDHDFCARPQILLKLAHQILQNLLLDCNPLGLLLQILKFLTQLVSLHLLFQPSSTIMLIMDEKLFIFLTS